MTSNHVLTPEGLKNLQEQIKELEQVIIPDIITRLKKAHADGDLRENNPYTQAKEDYAAAKTKLEQLKEIVRTAKVIDNKNKKEIMIGTKVKIRMNNLEKEITICASVEADPLNNKISIDSPIGKALANKKQGETAELVLVNGQKQTIEILEIEN